MKIFELNLIGYETYVPVLYYNPNKTDEEFKADVSKVLNEFVDEIDTNDEYKNYSFNMYDIHQVISVKLFDEGYEKLEKYTVSFNENYSLSGNEYNLSYFLTNGCKVIHSMLSDDKIEKIFNHNKKVDRLNLIENLKDIEYGLYFTLNDFKFICESLNLNYNVAYNELSDDARIALYNAHDNNEFRDLAFNLLRRFTGIVDEDGNKLYEKDWILFTDPDNKYANEPVCIKWNNIEQEFDVYNPNCCDTCKNSFGSISSLDYAISVGGKFKIVKKFEI